MQAQSNRHPVSGHVFLYNGKRGSVWYAKYRLPDGRQVQKKLGPAAEGKGRPKEGSLTKATAKAKLDEILTDARRGTLAGMVRTGATVKDAAEEWLRHAEHERAVKPSTLREYRSVVRMHVLPTFGDRRVEQVTTAEVERWRAELLAEGRLARRTIDKLVTNLHGIFERARRVHGLRVNPVADLERHRQSYSGSFDFYSVEEVLALVRAAESEQDAAVFLTAAMSGLRRGELIALRWRDADFEGAAIRVRASYAAERLTTPKSGKVRTVPMVRQVAEVLAKLSQRDNFTSEDDLVFPSPTGNYLDATKLRRRFKGAQARAELRPLRFHDLRHTFGSLAINRASIVQVQSWMGHADVDTTMRYLHHKSRADEAELLAGAFEVEQTAAEPVVEEEAQPS